MSYGPQKYPSPEIVEAILASVRKQLRRSDCFSNPSLGYHGAEWDFTLQFRLSARMDTLAQVTGQGKVEAPPVIAGEEADAAVAVVITEDVTGAGEVGAPKPQPEPGQHILSHEPTPSAPEAPEQAAITKEGRRKRMAHAVEGTAPATDASGIGG